MKRVLASLYVFGASFLLLSLPINLEAGCEKEIQCSDCSSNQYACPCPQPGQCGKSLVV